MIVGSLVSAAIAGCYLNPGDGWGSGNGNGNGNNNGTQNVADAGIVTSDAGVPNDLPCDVAQAISSCLGCHGPTPTNGAPISLASYADLTANSVQYPGQTEAQRAVARMNGSPSQMPPLPAPAAAQADITTISNWIAAAYPHGTCGSPNTDGGSVDPYNTPLTCTSKLTGTSQEGSSMNPGRDCLSCHSSGEEQMQLAGTVYPTAHEPDMCVGAGSQAGITGVQVVITDSASHTLTLTPSSSGNFHNSNGLPAGWTMPYTVKVLYQGRERDMSTPQTSGACNSCHTATGTNGAPGRIMLP